MDLSNKEEVLSLGKIDPEFQEYLTQIAASGEKAPSLAAPKRLGNAAGGETLEIAMRDGYMSQLRVHKPHDPLSATQRPAILLMYGGGMIEGDNSQLSRYAKAINKIYGATVINISYRLAPGNKFPTAPNDVWDSLKWIAANHKLLSIDLAAGFVVGGISAGANLAAVCTQRWLSEECSPPITGALLMIPWLLREEIVPSKYKHLYLSYSQNAQAPLFNSETVEKTVEAYAPDSKSADFSPFNAKNAHDKLPPTYIAVCGMDPLRDDGLIYHRVLKEHGVKTKLDVYPGVPHGHVLIPQLKSGQKFFMDFLVAVGWILGDEKLKTDIHGSLLTDYP